MIAGYVTSRGNPYNLHRFWCILYVRINAKQYVEVTCAATGETFLKDKKEYDRQVTKGNTRFFKNLKVARVFLGTEKRARSRLEKVCPNCGTPFGSSTKVKAATYCSRKCASVHSHHLLSLDPERVKKKSENVSKANSIVWEEIRAGKRPRPQFLRQAAPISERTRSCVTCGDPFVLAFVTQNRKTCSKDCSFLYRQKLSRENPNVGGECYPRKRLYKGISMDSSWEVQLATWLDEQRIEWVRDRKVMFWWTDKEGNKRRYYPDFHLPKYGLYLDPKNKTLMVKDAFKLQQVRETYSVTILAGEVDSIIKAIQTHL